MKYYILSIFSLFILSACASTVLPSPEANPESLPTAQPSYGQSVNYNPLDTMTMVEEIDLILAAVADNNTQELIKLFHYTSTGCMTVNALGGPPPCRDDEAGGTMIEVLPFSGSEGSFLRRNEIQKWPGLDVIGIYAVFEVSGSAFSDENYPTGEYGIALVGEKEAPNIVLQVRNQGIVKVDYIFEAYGSGLAEVLERDAENLILPPVLP